MAAFERISRVRLSVISTTYNVLDVRFVELPYYRPKQTGFDPTEHRHPKVAIKVWMAYFNLIKLSFGTGMLGMPQAVSQLGIILGPILVLCIGLLIIHTHLVLMWCLNEISRQLKISSISYRYGFRMALLHGPPCLHPIGKIGPTLVAIFMFLSQFGICTLLIIFTAENLRDMMDWPNINRSLIVLFGPYMLLEIAMKNFRQISQVVMLGNIMNFFGLIVSSIALLFTVEFRGEIRYLPNGFINFFFALGSLLYNMTAMGVCLSCEKALEDPKIMTKKWGVIQLGLLIPTVASALYGAIGYCRFGLVMENNILRYFPFDSIATQAALALYLFTAGLTYPIMCYPGIQILLEVIKNHDPLFEPSNESLKIIKKFLRPIFVVSSFFLAYLLPSQGPFVAMIGNFCTTMLSMVFPALMEIGINYPKYYGNYGYILIKDVAIVIIGVLSCITGTILCAYLLYITIVQSNGLNAFE